MGFMLKVTNSSPGLIFVNLLVLVSSLQVVVYLLIFHKLGAKRRIDRRVYKVKVAKRRCLARHVCVSVCGADQARLSHLLSCSIWRPGCDGMRHVPDRQMAECGTERTSQRP